MKFPAAKVVFLVLAMPILVIPNASFNFEFAVGLHHIEVNYKPLQPQLHVSQQAKSVLNVKEHKQTYGNPKITTMKEDFQELRKLKGSSLTNVTMSSVIANTSDVDQEFLTLFNNGNEMEFMWILHINDSDIVLNVKEHNQTYGNPEITAIKENVRKPRKLKRTSLTNITISSVIANTSDVDEEVVTLLKKAFDELIANTSDVDEEVLTLLKKEKKNIKFTVRPVIPILVVCDVDDEDGWSDLIWWFYKYFTTLQRNRKTMDDQHKWEDVVQSKHCQSIAQQMSDYSLQEYFEMSTVRRITESCNRFQVSRVCNLVRCEQMEDRAQCNTTRTSGCKVCHNCAMHESSGFTLIKFPSCENTENENGINAAWSLTVEDAYQMIHATAGNKHENQYSVFQATESTVVCIQIIECESVYVVSEDHSDENYKGTKLKKPSVPEIDILTANSKMLLMLNADKWSNPVWFNKCYTMYPEDCDFILSVNIKLRGNHSAKIQVDLMVFSRRIMDDQCLPQKWVYVVQNIASCPQEMLDYSLQEFFELSPAKIIQEACNIYQVSRVCICLVPCKDMRDMDQCYSTQTSECKVCHSRAMHESSGFTFI